MHSNDESRKGIGSMKVR